MNEAANTGFGTVPGDPAKALSIGGVGEHLSTIEVSSFVESALAVADLDGKRSEVCHWQRTGEA